MFERVLWDLKKSIRKSCHINKLFHLKAFWKTFRTFNNNLENQKCDNIVTYITEISLKLTLLRILGILLKPGARPWTRILKNLDPEKPEPLKTWTQKNLDPKKPGPRKSWTLKNLNSKYPGLWKMRETAGCSEKD